MRTSLTVWALLMCVGCSAFSTDLFLYEGIVKTVVHHGKGTTHEAVELTLADGRVLILRIRPGQVREFHPWRDYRIVYNSEGYLVACEDTAKQAIEWRRAVQEAATAR